MQIGSLIVEIGTRLEAISRALARECVDVSVLFARWLSSVVQAVATVVQRIIRSIFSVVSQIAQWIWSLYISVEDGVLDLVSSTLAFVYLARWAAVLLGVAIGLAHFDLWILFTLYLACVVLLCLNIDTIDNSQNRGKAMQKALSAHLRLPVRVVMVLMPMIVMFLGYGVFKGLLPHLGQDPAARGYVSPVEVVESKIARRNGRLADGVSSAQAEMPVQSRIPLDEAISDPISVPPAENHRGDEVAGDAGLKPKISGGTRHRETLAQAIQRRRKTTASDSELTSPPPLTRQNAEEYGGDLNAAAGSQPGRVFAEESERRTDARAEERRLAEVQAAQAEDSRRQGKLGYTIPQPVGSKDLPGPLEDPADSGQIDRPIPDEYSRSGTSVEPTLDATRRANSDGVSSGQRFAPFRSRLDASAKGPLGARYDPGINKWVKFEIKNTGSDSARVFFDSGKWPTIVAAGSRYDGYLQANTEHTVRVDLGERVIEKRFVIPTRSFVLDIGGAAIRLNR